MEDLPALFVTLRYSDVINLKLCYELHRLCNGKQFESLPGSEFANFINLRKTSRCVNVKPREGLRVCYLIYMLSKHTIDSSMSQEWREKMLDLCNISESYYKSHYKDAENSDAKGMPEFTKELRLILGVDRKS